MEKERRCLRCNKMFLSLSKGNRICQRCKGSSANSMAPSVPAGARDTMVKRVRHRVGDDRWQANPLFPPRGED